MSSLLLLLRDKYLEITREISTYGEAFNCVDDESFEADRLRREVSYLRQIQEQIRKRIEYLEDERVRISQDW